MSDLSKEEAQGMAIQLSWINVEMPAIMHSIENKLSIINQKISEAQSGQSEAIWQVVNRNGISFFVDKRSLVDKCIIDQGAWEEPQIDFLTHLVEKYRDDKPLYFFDIGSYFGYYSLVFNNRFPDANIYAFEANPMTYIQLKANLLCNNLHDKITALNAVVCSSAGETYVADNVEYMDNRAGWAVDNSGSGKKALVKNVVIDEYFHDLKDKFIMMKIDVEGYEAEVINGLKDILKENKVIMQVECFDFIDELRRKFEDSLRGLGLRKINQIHFDHYYVNFGDDTLVEKLKDVNVPASRFCTNLNTRDPVGHIAFDKLSGHICYGPFMWVAQGKKKVVFKFAKGAILDGCIVHVFSNYAHTISGNGFFHVEAVDEKNYNAETGELTIYYEHPPFANGDVEFSLISQGNGSGVFLSAVISPQ